MEILGLPWWFWLISLGPWVYWWILGRRFPETTRWHEPKEEILPPPARVEQSEIQDKLDKIARASRR